MLIRSLIRLCLAGIILIFPSYVFCEEYKSTIDYIQKTNKLWGISACIANEDGSITLVDSKGKGYGYALWIPDGKGGFLEKITLKPRESFELIDGHHAFITYRFIGFKDGRIKTLGAKNS
jgi:hypothetical protein